MELTIQLITALAALLGLFFAFKASRRTSYINTITAERIKWLGNLKELVSELLVVIQIMTILS